MARLTSLYDPYSSQLNDAETVIAYLTQCYKVVFIKLKLINFVPDRALFLYRFEWIVETDEHVLLRVELVARHIL